MILALHNYFSGNDNSRRCMFGGLHENRCFALAQLFPSLIKLWLHKFQFQQWDGFEFSSFPHKHLESTCIDSRSINFEAASIRISFAFRGIIYTHSHDLFF